MAADAATPRPVARGWLLALALLCGAAAIVLASLPELPAPAWLVRWSQDHPDPRILQPDEQLLLAQTLGQQRRDDAVLLLAALAAGCALVAARPAFARPAGVLAAVLAMGSVALGVHAAGASLAGQLQGARDGSWSLGDDSLAALAGPHTDALRSLRERIGEQDAVLLVGTNQPLFNAAAWALAPRAVFPVLQDVPEQLTSSELLAFARTLRQGSDFPRRWLVDLAALERGPSAGRPALLELAP